MTELKVFFAEINDGCMDDYVDYHNKLPEAIARNLKLKAISSIKTFRKGNLLTMLVWEDDDAAQWDKIDRKSEDEWDRLMAPLFKQFWQRGDKVFDMDEHVHKI